MLAYVWRRTRNAETSAAVTVVLGAASVGGLFHVSLGNASRRRPPGHRIVFHNASIYGFPGRRRNHR